ncbi:erythroblast NAD(P)(+)--arginine ADP-ribosyltransferase-like [Osmerus eperlanus]|uniref:erythroblast NAD(P)(+)--arginine ADP-ribosyltransferase-like n=1 Tax=Osmerus eperlanus TaxID=29151 RepID=UPI002E14BE29
MADVCLNVSVNPAKSMVCKPMWSHHLVCNRTVPNHCMKPRNQSGFTKALTEKVQHILREASSNLVSIYPLDMAINSVDDDYQGCERQMLLKVQQKYLPKEMCLNFSTAWKEAENYYNENPSGPLDKMEAMAIHVYVNPFQNVYKPFNSATLIGKANYMSEYQYHSLHFLLTRALQKLNKRNIKKIV